MTHYGVELEVVKVAMPPGKLPGTSMLLDDEADFVGPLNATGGKTQQHPPARIPAFYLHVERVHPAHSHVPAKSKLAKEINTTGTT